MGNQRDRLVPQPEARLDQTPAQIHVLADGHRLIESADLQDGRASANDRCTGHIGHRPVRHHRAFPFTEVEGRTHLLVAGDQVAALTQGDDPGRRKGDVGVAEVPEEAFQPPLPRYHIGIKERYEFIVAVGNSSVACRAGPFAPLMTQNRHLAR